jgi:hypothetical protein
MGNIFGNYKRNNLFYFWGNPKIVLKTKYIELINILYFNNKNIRNNLNNKYNI